MACHSKICFPCVNYAASTVGAVLWRLYGARGTSQCGMPCHKTNPTKHTRALIQISVRYFILAAPKSFSERVASNRENQTLDCFQQVCFYLKHFEPSVRGVKMTLTFPFVAAEFCHVALLPFQNASNLEGKLDGRATQLGKNLSDRLICESSSMRQQRLECNKWMLLSWPDPHFNSISGSDWNRSSDWNESCVPTLSEAVIMYINLIYRFLTVACILY